MPRMYIKKRPPKPYTEVDLQNALKDVQSGKLKLLAAASNYNIPLSTLSDHLSNKVKFQANHGACLVSSLSVRDIALNKCPASPCTSTMRCRDINQDMEALRISRQDNPFLQVLASRESLADSLEELESDDVNLMAQQEADVDPLTLPDIHQHMVRSPPPVSWPRSPIFRFDSSQESLEKTCLSPTPKCYQSLNIIHTGYERESSSQAMDLIGGLSGRKSDVR